MTDDRLVEVEVSKGARIDRIRFALSASMTPPPTERSLEVTTSSGGPYVADPSGLRLNVDGARFVLVTLRGMTLADSTGTPVYAGPATFSEPGPGVRSVVRQSAYEGVTTWIVGYDSASCATAEGGDGTLTLVVLHD